MPNLTLPSTLDLVRLIKPSVAETVEALVLHYSTIPPWTYGPARGMALPAFSGEISLDAAVRGCQTKGIQSGRESNAEVAQLVWQAGSGRNVKCFRLHRRPFFIRNDLSFAVDPLFFFIEAGQVKIFWLQPRRGFNPTFEGLGIVAVILRMSFADDFDNFDVELLDLSKPEGMKQRVARKFSFATLPVISDDDVREALARFAEAYDIVAAMGVQRPERHSRAADDSQSDFWK